MTGEDNNDSNNNNSYDDSNDGKDDSNDGRNGDSVGSGGGKIGGDVGGKVGGVVGGKISGMVGGCVIFLVLTYRRNHTDMLWNKFILVQTGKNDIRHVRPGKIEFILFVLIPGLFYVYSGLNPGLNYLDQF
jgi:hypothetical protein